MAWNSDTTYALNLQRIIAQIIGIWPENSTDMSSKMRVTFVTVVQVWICIDVTKQFIIKGYCGSILELVDVITHCMSALIIVIKMILVTIYRRNLYIIINSAIEDWSNISDRKSRSIMLRYARIGRIILIVQVFGVLSINFQVIFDSFRTTEDVWNHQTNSSIQLPGVPIWPTCWIPVDISTYHLTVHFVAQSFAMLIYANSYAIFNALLYSIAIHLCGQFQVLNTNLRYFHIISDIAQYRYHLNKFIERHSHLIMLADKFEETYSLNILAEIGMGIILICISGIVLLIGIRSSDANTVSAMIVRIFMLNIGIFVHCYIGEQLNCKTSKLRATIYNIPWHDMSPSIVKDIMFIMMRCNDPMNLTAGKIYNMNSHNFMGILKTIFSYFSVIRLMFE